MNDIMSRINELLSDEESAKQISELAQMLVNDDKEADTEDKTADMPDLSSVLKLSSVIAEASEKDRNSDLITALKPHLSEEKQKKADKAIKLLKLIAIWEIVKDSGLLQEFI